MQSQAPVPGLPELADMTDAALPSAMMTYKNMLKSFVKQDSPAFTNYMKRGWRMLRDLKPADPVEEILAVQLLHQEARLAYLNHFALEQNTRQNIQMFHVLCDHALFSLNRTARTFGDYRRPRQTSFLAVRHANIVEKQIVTNFGRRKNAKRLGKSVSGQAKKPNQLSVDPARIGNSPQTDPPHPALEKSEGPENVHGKDYLQPERP
jgi:hypothetical protein